MELILVAISLASLISNVVLVRHFTKNRVFLPATTESLPLWQDAAEQNWDIPVDDDPPAPPAAVAAVADNSPWVNREGIQQSVNSAPLPPIKPVPRPPLARPDGFAR